MKENVKNLVRYLGTHLTEISAKDIFFGRRKGGRKIEGSGIRLLPSTSAFHIFLNEINPLLKEVGITRRLENRMHFEAHENSRMNRYAKYMVNQLMERKDNPEEF